MNSPTLNIELLWFDDCPNHHAATELLQSTLDEFGVSDPIRFVKVPILATGEKTKFAGSPTIRKIGRAHV